MRTLKCSIRFKLPIHFESYEINISFMLFRSQLNSTNPSSALVSSSLPGEVSLDARREEKFKEETVHDVRTVLSLFVSTTAAISVNCPL